VEFLPFGIDPRWFAIERSPPGEGPAKWLAVTRLTHDKLGPLFEWAAPLFEGQRRELHLIGPNQQSVAVPAWVHYHGAASADELAQKWFPTAQGLLTLSRHAEGRPQVVLEAMAAGLPVVASPLAAHSGVVEHQRTGWLVDSPAALVSALSEAEDPLRNEAVGAAAKARVLAEAGTWDDAARRYLSILQSLERA
jgi:glycosyltransferase involved in cell wall biosynthesis